MGGSAQRLARVRALESLVRELAREEILPRYLKTARRRKADGSLFTEADMESQRRLVAALPKLMPGPVLGSEMTAAAQAELWQNGHRGMWCIDPIDGTPNFANGLPDAVAGVDFKRISHHLGDELAVRPPYFSQRNFGSSALEWCFVAAGRLDVYLHGGQMLWDYAAGRLILQEAGGEFAALDGDSLLAGPAVKRGVIAAASPGLFREWRAWLQAHS